MAERAASPTLVFAHFTLLLCAACGSDPVPAPGSGVPVTLAPPAEGEGFQIDEGTFSVAPGREALFCERYPIPAAYGDAPVFVRGIASRLPAGTHHYFMSYGEEPLAAPEPCVGDDPLLYLDDPSVEQGAQHAVDGKLAFTAAVGEDEYMLPDDYALYLETGLGHFTTSHHALNFTEASQSLYGLVNVYTAPQDAVRHPVNVLNCTLRDISIAAHSQGELSGTCTVPFDLDMVILSSHAHQYLTRFEMRVFDGEKTLPDVIYESTQWDSPAIVPLAEPLALKTGQGLTFTCHYDNATDQEIVYGAGQFEEMCATMSAFAYPADRPFEIPPSLGGVVYTSGTAEPLFDTSDLGGPF
jgi:hypothetical protein